MSSTSTEPRSKIRFEEPEDIEDEVELKIKRRFGRGLFVDKYDVMDGAISIKLGNQVPKDVSDCRERDRVLKFISYKPVYTLKAEETGNGYLIELPNRNEIYEGFVDRKKMVARRLDTTMAKSIYEELASFGLVQTQLQGVKDILWVVREKQPVDEDEIYAMRGQDSTDQTRMYLHVLEETEFIRRDDGMLYSGVNLNAHDQLEIESDEFSKVVLGQIVQEAYHTLKDELNLTLLQHYPKYAGSYYYSALQRDKPDLRLDVETITDNLHTVYGDSHVHRFTVEKKLNELAEAKVVHKDDDLYYGNDDVFEDVASQTPV